MVQTAPDTIYNGEQEREAKTQERERRKEIKHAHMLAALQGSPLAGVLEGQGKCLICRQAGH